MIEILLYVLISATCTIVGVLAGWRLATRKKPEKTNVSYLENAVTKLEFENRKLYEDIGSAYTLLCSKDKDLVESNRQLEEHIAKLDLEAENNRKILSMKKSSEIRTGHIAEQLAPFLAGFQHNPRNLKYLGQPIDYISFGPDYITFIEVKSGKSHLSHNQKHIRKLIEDKKIKFEEFRVRGIQEWKKKKKK